MQTHLLHVSSIFNVDLLFFLIDYYYCDTNLLVNVIFLNINVTGKGKTIFMDCVLCVNDEGISEVLQSLEH